MVPRLFVCLFVFVFVNCLFCLLVLVRYVILFGLCFRFNLVSCVVLLVSVLFV